MITYSGEIFDKVLYRNNDGELWNVSFYGGCMTVKDADDKPSLMQFVVSENQHVKQIIPYNESTACLLLTQNPAPDKYLIREKLQNQSVEETELSFEMIYTVLEASIRHNNMYNVTYTGSDLLIEEANKSVLNRDVYDRAMYVLHNGGSVQLHRIEVPKSFNKPTFCDFDREVIYKVVNYLYEADPEFQECFTDILTDTEELVTPVSSYNCIIDTIVTEEITHVGAKDYRDC